MKILVVDDEKIICNIIQNGFGKDKHTVDLANNHGECMQLLERSIYDLIIIDTMMPTKDGIAIPKELRDKNIQTPILCLTAKDAPGDIVTGLNAGCDDCLVKPFAFAELLARTRALIRRSKQNRGSELIYAGFRLDPIKHKVWSGEEEISFTQKEYTLFEYFMRNPEQVLTRPMIAEHVWAYKFDAFTNIIDVYINYLRKKIGRNGRKKSIHTVRGVGYILKGMDSI